MDGIQDHSIHQEAYEVFTEADYEDCEGDPFAVGEGEDGCKASQDAELETVEVATA